MSVDHKNRDYLSVSEVAAYTHLSVRKIHGLVKTGEMPAYKSAGGQYRFRLQQIKSFRRTDNGAVQTTAKKKAAKRPNDSESANAVIAVNDTTQKIIHGDARNITDIPDNSVHLAITSPPYFNAKMYSDEMEGDLGNMHDLEEWLHETGKVWAEVLRVLSPGRKFFLNIMNLPIRENKSFRLLNLAGRTADMCDQMGFILKRDIIWHKTNGVRAHFGTYPWPGGILINNMHEFILELEKPGVQNGKKYAHVTAEQKIDSKLDREFWLSLKNSDVWLMKPERGGGGREHSAPFPEELPMRFIRAYSYIGETVFDPFCGSGTTLAVAAHWKRNGVGVDINGDFCKMTAQRLQGILT